MKMLLIICPDFRRSDVRDLTAKHDVHAVSELTDITGEGVTGSGWEPACGRKNRF